MDVNDSIEAWTRHWLTWSLHLRRYNRCRWGIGTIGPAITASIMITRNKIALALFVGLGPIFIMPLLLDQPKNLFQCWLLYGISTLFSLAGLYVMVYLAMDMTLAVAGGLFAGTNGWGLYSACQEEL